MYVYIYRALVNSLGRIISQRSEFDFRSTARALAAGLPHQDHVYKTTDESFRFHNQKIDEMRCNWIPGISFNLRVLTVIVGTKVLHRFFDAGDWWGWPYQSQRQTQIK